MKTLTDRQTALLQHIADCSRQGVAPVVDDLRQKMGYAQVSSIRYMLEAIESKGYIRTEGGRKGRQLLIALTEKGRAMMPTASDRTLVPVLGTIPAGPLQVAVETCDTFVDTGDALAARPGDFLLEVTGDSMIGDGILERDLVLLRPEVEPRSGEIAAVQIGRDSGESAVTLKHVHFQPGDHTIRLRPSNPVYDDIEVPATEARIIGVYRGLIRSA